MKILFDQGTPAPLRRHLLIHDIDTAYERDWSDLQNGDLLDVAEQAGCKLLITTDQSLHHQQQLAGRKLAILVLMSTDWRRIQTKVDAIREAITDIGPSGYVEVPI